MFVTMANLPALSGNVVKSHSLIQSENRISVFNQPLEELLNESQAILFHFHTVFPFDLFPDEITIDQDKFNIVKKTFFFTYNVHSVLISDISDVSVETGLFFACLIIIDSSNYRFPIEVKVPYLTKKNAFQARKILQGLIAIKRRHISLASIPLDQVKNEVGIVGETSVKSIRGI